MKTKALVTALLLGTSVAGLSPAFVAAAEGWK